MRTSDQRPGQFGRLGAFAIGTLPLRQAAQVRPPLHDVAIRRRREVRRQPARRIGLVAIARRDHRSPAHDQPQRLDRVVRDEPGADELAQRVAQVARRERRRRQQLVEERRALALRATSRTRCACSLERLRRSRRRSRRAPCRAERSESSTRFAGFVRLRRRVPPTHTSSPSAMSRDERRRDRSRRRAPADTRAPTARRGARGRTSGERRATRAVVAGESRRRIEVLPALHEAREARAARRLRSACAPARARGAAPARAGAASTSASSPRRRRTCRARASRCASTRRAARSTHVASKS